MTDSADHTGANSRIDLAQEPDFEIGAMRVFPSTREVVTFDGRQTVEPRVMQVFVCLVRAEGKVVSRDKLIHCCWSDQLVSDDAINRCVAKVRHLAETDGPPHFLVETIRRIGYRLIPHTNGKNGASPDAKNERGNDTSKAPIVTGRALLAAIALSVLFLIAVFFARQFLPLHKHMQWNLNGFHPLATTAMTEQYPAISPDGTMIAYTQGDELHHQNIIIQNIAGGDPIAFTDGPGDHLSPSWSDDGSRIAYVLAEPKEPCRIMVKPFPSGETREVARCTTEERTVVHWIPHSNSLLFLDRQHSGASRRQMRVDLETGKQSTVTHPAPHVEETAASPSFDGRNIAFGRLIRDGREDLLIHELKSGRERVILHGISTRTDQTVRAEAWLDNNNLLISTFLNGESGLAILNIHGGRPVRLGFAGPSAIGNLAAGRNGFVAAVFEKPGGTLLGINLKNTDHHISALHPRNESDSDPAYSSNGTLAVISVNGGRKTISVTNGDTAFHQLRDFGQDTIKQPTWSNDGSLLAVTLIGKRREGIEIVDSSGTQRYFAALSALEIGKPAWIEDDRALLVPLKDAQGWRLWKIDLSAPVKATPYSEYGWRSVRTSGNDIYAVKESSSGIWRYDSGERRKLTDGPTAQNPIWQIAGDRFLFGMKDGDDTVQIFAAPLDGGKPVHILDLSGFNCTEQFAVDRRLNMIVYAKRHRDSDIGLFHLEWH